MKQNFLMFILSLTLLLSACAGGSVAEASPLAGVFPDQTSTAQAAYFSCGATTEWDLTREELDSLEAWALALDLSERSFQEGEAPGDRDGGSGYTFQLGDKSFSYVFSGEAGYILLENTWYLAGNPSAPPLSVPGAPELTVEEMERVEAYHYIVPADAEKKIVTDAASIQEVLNLLYGTAATGTPPEAVTGGAVVSFRLTLATGETREWICSEAADALWSVTGPEGTFETMADCAEVWDHLPGEAQTAGEQELPVLS